MYKLITNALNEGLKVRIFFDDGQSLLAYGKFDPSSNHLEDGVSEEDSHLIGITLYDGRVIFINLNKVTHFLVALDN